MWLHNTTVGEYDIIVNQMFTYWPKTCLKVCSAMRIAILWEKLKTWICVFDVCRYSDKYTLDFKKNGTVNSQTNYFFSGKLHVFTNNLLFITC